jgi:PAS domain-containing protein
MQEDRLRETERIQRLLLDSTVAFIGILEPDGTLRYANEPALGPGGVTRDEGGWEEVLGLRVVEPRRGRADASEGEGVEKALARADRPLTGDAVVRMAGGQPHDDRFHAFAGPRRGGPSAVSGAVRI